MYWKLRRTTASGLCVGDISVGDDSGVDSDDNSGGDDGTPISISLAHPLVGLNKTSCSKSNHTAGKQASVGKPSLY